MNDDIMKHFCSIAENALKVNEDFSKFWNEIDFDKFDIESDDLKKNEIVNLLKTLIIKRIEIVNSFCLLAKIDKSVALEIIERRYLGANICPYRKIGGYQNELSLILSDYLEIFGKTIFVNDILIKYLESKKLNDPNVISSFCEALDFEREAEFKSLVSELKKKKVLDL